MLLSAGMMYRVACVTIGTDCAEDAEDVITLLLIGRFLVTAGFDHSTIFAVSKYATIC
jgi:hypothetical protein